MRDRGHGHQDDQSSDGRIIVTNTFSRERELIMELLQLFKRERRAETGSSLGKWKTFIKCSAAVFPPHISLGHKMLLTIDVDT